MKAVVNTRDEGGWMITYQDGVFQTMRYIIPVDGGFAVVNPFDISPSDLVHSTFEFAQSAAIQQVYQQFNRFTALDSP